MMSRYLAPRVVDAVVAYVSAATGVPAEAMHSESRRRPEARARQQVMWWLRKQGYSYPQIGRAFDRDHTTAIHAERAVDKRFAETGQASIHRINEGMHSLCTGARANIRRMKKTPKPIPARLPRPKFAVVRARVEEAAAAHNLPIGFLLGSSRARHIVDARRHAWRALIQDGYSLNGIANAWGCSRKSLQRVRDEMALAVRIAAE